MTSLGRVCPRFFFSFFPFQLSFALAAICAADWGPPHVASRRVITRRSAKYPGIKHVGRAMTLNLPFQTLHDLNHRRSSPSPPPFSFPVPVSAARSRSPPRRRFLGLAATCRTYRGILPHLVVVPPATPSLALHPPFPSTSLRHPFHLPDTLFSRRSTILSRFTAYRPRSPPFFPPVALSFPILATPSSLATRSFSSARRRNLRPANFDLDPRGYRLHDL